MPEAVSNLPEWPQHELLAHEKELLGFYVTGHPLTPLAPLLQRYCLHTTAQLAAVPNRSLTRLGGMIAAVTHGVSKKSGKPYSMVTLEDLEGSVQLLVMNDYDKFRPLLELNNPILVVGEVSTGEDRPKIFPQEIMPLQDAAKKYTRQVHLRLPMAHLQPDDLVKAQEIVAAHAGKCPLILCFLRPEGGSVFIEAHSRFGVAPSLELEHAVNRQFGDKAYYAVVDRALPEKARRAWEKKGGANGEE
jgi:DNA polymerase-3 subunit alpha